ncbi:MAG: division/cell wall cluster transcriptional repressor MraZ [Armatimonadota bacterium]
MREFVGEFEHILDDKGRVIIPVKFRCLLGDRFYLSISLNETCLCAYPADEWERLSNELLRKIHPLDKEGQKFLRIFTSSATICEIDKQGRIFIPPILRQKGGLSSKNITLVGALSHVEIWSTGSWKDLNKDVEISQLAQEIYNKGNI